MKLFLLSLLVSYASAGVILGFTDRKTLGAAGNTRTKIPETLAISSFPAGGKFEAYLVPYANSKQGGKVTDIVELIWHNPKGEQYSLDMMTVNWPAKGKHTLSQVKPSISPKAIDKKLTITVNFQKTAGTVMRTYTYDKVKNIYTAS